MGKPWQAHETVRKPFGDTFFDWDDLKEVEDKMDGGQKVGLIKRGRCPRLLEGVRACVRGTLCELENPSDFDRDLTGEP